MIYLVMGERERTRPPQRCSQPRAERDLPMSIGVYSYV